MPTYDYLCSNCDMIEQLWKSIHDDSDSLCQVCNEPMTKVINPPMFNKKQGKSEIIKTDNRGSHIEKHWDGRQDVHVVPETVKIEK